MIIVNIYCTSMEGYFQVVMSMRGCVWGAMSMESYVYDGLCLKGLCPWGVMSMRGYVCEEYMSMRGYVYERLSLGLCQWGVMSMRGYVLQLDTQDWDLQHGTWHTWNMKLTLWEAHGHMICWHVPFCKIVLHIKSVRYNDVACCGAVWCIVLYCVLVHLL